MNSLVIGLVDEQDIYHLATEEIRKIRKLFGEFNTNYLVSPKQKEYKSKITEFGYSPRPFIS